MIESYGIGTSRSEPALQAWTAERVREPRVGPGLVDNPLCAAVAVLTETCVAALPVVLALCPSGVRVAVWRRCGRTTVSWEPVGAGEPVIYHPAHRLDTVTLGRGLIRWSPGDSDAHPSRACPGTKQPGQRLPGLADHQHTARLPGPEHPDTPPRNTQRPQQDPHQHAGTTDNATGAAPGAADAGSPCRSRLRGWRSASQWSAIHARIQPYSG
jgi:hypothetical protein